MEQLLPGGPSLARDSGDHSSGSACVCWYGCELPAQHVCVQTTVLTPEGGLHTQV